MTSNRTFNGKRLLYLSTVEKGPFEGVLKKIANQCTAFSKMGFETTHINAGERSFFGQIEKLVPFGYGLNYRQIKKTILSLERNAYDYCYFRYSPASKGLIDVLRVLKRTQQGIRIVLEIPTYPYDDELHSVKAFPSKIKDRIYRRKMKGLVDLAVTPSYLSSNNIFGIPALEITNGIDSENIKARKSVQHPGVINMVGVALISERQGYDRVILGLHDYSKKRTDKDPIVNFYIIGTGSAKKELEALTAKLGLTENVFFVGEKSGEELDYYYDIADIGIGVVGLYKTKDLQKTNSLKTREYCAKGLPFVITKSDYVFADSGEDFCLVVSETDEPISIFSLIEYLHFLESKYEKKELETIMGVFAKTKINWSAIFSRVMKRVDSLGNSNESKQ